MTMISEQPYLFGYVNNERILIENSVEQICAFIMKYQFNDTVIADTIGDEQITTVFGGFIMSCRNQQFLANELQPTIVPYQLGEKEAPVFIPYEKEDEEFIVKNVCYYWAGYGMYAVTDVSFEFCKDEDFDEDERLPYAVEEHSRFFETKEELFEAFKDFKIYTMEEAIEIAKEKNWM